MTREHSAAAGLPVLFVAGDPNGREERAAGAWLARDPAYAVTAAAAAELDPAALAHARVVWVHAAEHAPALPPQALQALEEHVARGGGVVLTLFGTALVVPLRLETSPPNRAGVTVWHDGPGGGEPRGVHAWGQHPLVEGLGRGTNTWVGTEGARVGQATYARPRWPAGGRVALVERVGDAIEPGVAVAWDYTHAGPRVVCIGAHVHFAAAGAHAAGRNQLVHNALRMVTREAPGRAVWWPAAHSAPALVEPVRLPGPSLGPALPEVGSAISLSGAAAGGRPFALAGRRAFVVGDERGGVEEVWTHPVCVVGGGIEVRVDGDAPEVRSVDVSPEQVVRHLTTRTRFVEERVFVPLDEGAATVEYRYRRLGKGRADVAAPRLELRFTIPLRLDAPLPADALHPLRAARAGAHDAVVTTVVGRDEHYAAVVSVEGAAVVGVANDDTGVRVSVSASLGERLRVTFAGTALGRAALERTLTAVARRGWRGLALRRAERVASLQHDHFALRTPSAALDTAVEWAKARLVSALATVPGSGTGALVGYGAAGNGEPAPATWFGAGAACRVGRALLAVGLFSEAKAVLDFLATHTGPDGMPHDVTTAGAAFDADPTAAALFAHLAADYEAWTGDVTELRAVWPAVAAVVEASVERTDWPPDAARAWAEAGAALAPVAARLGDPATADRCGALAALARRVTPAPIVPDHFRHALDLALAAYEGARGAFPGAVAVGARGTRAAFADSAAGAAELVLAVVEGLLGAEPDAAARRVRLTPRWPREWAHATVHHVRVGDATVELEAVEGCLVDGVPHDGVTYRVRSVPARALTLTLEHPVGARAFTQLRVDGTDAEVERCGTTDRPHVRVTRWLAEPVELQFVGEPIER